MRRVTLFLVPLFLVSLFSVAAQENVNFAILDAGVLIATTGERVDLVESFSLTRREDGSHKLISTIVDRFEQVKSQDLSLSASFEPQSYSRFQSSASEDERTIRASFIDNRAIVSITNLDGVEQQTFTTDTEFIVFDDSAISHLSTMLERFLLVGAEILEFDALIAESLRAIPSTFQLLGDINLRSGDENFVAQDYAWDVAGGGRVLRVLERNGQFIGGIQERPDGSTDLISRQDLYPEGLDIIE